MSRQHRRSQSTGIKSLVHISLIGLSVFLATGEAQASGHASQSSAVVTAHMDTGAAPMAPCGVIEDFGGKTQVLDASRSNLLDTDVRTPLPCGAWVSTEEGWARIVHRDGYRITIGSNTFVELTGDETGTADHLVLYRGQVKVRAGAGASTEELKVSTPHARMRMRRGQAIVLFSQGEQETQVIAIENSATLENRFEAAKRVKIGEGEASSLNFKALRVMPSLPQAIASATVRQKLIDLRLDDRAKGEAMLAVRQRQSRKFASWLASDGENGVAPTRKPAGLAFEKSEYRRHPPRRGDEVAKDHWTKRLVAGVQDGEKILHPDRFYGRPGEVKLVVEDVAPKDRQVDREKERLLRELSQIRAE